MQYHIVRYYILILPIISNIKILLRTGFITLISLILDLIYLQYSIKDIVESYTTLLSWCLSSKISTFLNNYIYRRYNYYCKEMVISLLYFCNNICENNYIQIAFIVSRFNTILLL